MHNNDNPVEELVHLYVDGAFSRRELMDRVSKYAGGLAAAATALASLGVPENAEAQTPVTPGPQVPEGAKGIVTASVSFAAQDGATVLGYLAYPDPLPAGQLPGVIVVHENRGLVDHIKDVTRRVAVAGFVAVGVDLLSRQGGTDQFPDAVTQAAAYGRTSQPQRRLDMVAALDYLKHRSYVQFNKIGAVGFCAGGGNVWDLALILPELAAAVAFYGTPLPSLDLIDLIQTPVLGNYAELDRNLSLQTQPVVSAMLTKQKTIAFRLYQGVGHAFNNDTGPAYDAAAAADAWVQTIAWFTKFLGAPSPGKTA